ncbi:hypothetical protein K2X05_02890, partial [bacterium]|nr:hypothetical protein [bacterium]
MTALKQLKLNDTYNREEFSNDEFQFQSDLLQTQSDWSDYLKQFDISLREDLPLDIQHFDGL